MSDYIKFMAGFLMITALNFIAGYAIGFAEGLR